MILNRDLYSEEEVINNLLNEQIIVVGDFDNDLHDTHIGEIPGPVLTLAAYKYLKAGKHELKWWFVILLGILYFSISFITIVSNGHLANFFEDKPVLHCIISLLGLSLFFLILKFILYRYCLISMVIIAPTIVFWILSSLSFIQFEKYNQKQKKLLNNENTNQNNGNGVVADNKPVNNIQPK